MKLLLSALILSAVLFVAPTRAAPSSATQRWERLLFPVMERQMCGPGGAMVRLFTVTPAQCRRTFRYAARHCRRAAHQLPFYQVSDRTTGQSWGKWLGSCIGTAYDMKHTYKLPIP
jgi:hypothetical protein